MPGMGELVIILLIVLVVFGANKLPGIGDALGRSIKNFKRSSKVEDDDKADDNDKLETTDAKQLAPAAAPKQIADTSTAASKGDDGGEWEEVVVRRRKKAD